MEATIPGTNQTLSSDDPKGSAMNFAGAVIGVTGLIAAYRIANRAVAEADERTGGSGQGGPGGV